jgi:hypothetical protein
MPSTGVSLRTDRRAHAIGKRRPFDARDRVIIAKAFGVGVEKTTRILDRCGVMSKQVAVDPKAASRQTMIMKGATPKRSF